MSRSHTCTIIYTDNSTQHVTTKYNYSDTVTKALMLPGRILQLSSPSNSSGFTTPPQRLEGIFKWGPGPCTMAIRPQAAHEDAGPCPSPHPPCVAVMTIPYPIISQLKARIWRESKTDKWIQQADLGGFATWKSWILERCQGRIS